MEATIEELKSECSKEVIDHVRKIDQSFMKQSDPRALKVLADLEVKRGSRTLIAAVDIIDQKQISNPKRSIAYLIGIAMRIKGV